MSLIDYNNPNEYWRNMPYNGHDDNPNQIKNTVMQMVMFMLILFGTLVLCMLMGSCSSGREVVVVTQQHIKTDTVWQIHVLRDSVFVERHDSAVTYVTGDTVFVDRWHWRDRWRERVVRDTIYKSRADSSAVVAVTQKQTEPKRTWWQRVKEWCEGLLMVIGIIGIGQFLANRFLKR
jgi:hypothetical protein